MGGGSEDPQMRSASFSTLTFQARIAMLEGQRRSAENLKVDLLRRVKMLEFALRQERWVSEDVVLNAFADSLQDQGWWSRDRGGCTPRSPSGRGQAGPRRKGGQWEQ